VDSPRDGAFASGRKSQGNIRPEAPGLYEFIDANQRKWFYAVNVPPEESDLTPWPDLKQLASLESPDPSDAAAGSRRIFSVSDQAAESQQRTWWWLLAFCCVAMFGELALSNRTAI